MKPLRQGGEVISRAYYYLLDFNESDDWKMISEMFDVHKLNELNKEQFWKLFEEAVKQDLREN